MLRVGFEPTQSVTTRILTYVQVKRERSALESGPLDHSGIPACQSEWQHTNLFLCVEYLTASTSFFVQRSDAHEFTNGPC